MNNPSIVNRPNLNNPMAGALSNTRKEKKNKGNQPWMAARKKIRQNMFR